MKKERFEMRLTKHEKEELKRLSKEFGISITDYLLYNSLKKDVTGFIKGKEYAKWMRDYLYELNKIGVNVNQFVRKFNSNKGVFSAEELRERNREFMRFQNQLEDFQKEFTFLIKKLARKKG